MKMLLPFIYLFRYALPHTRDRTSVLTKKKKDLKKMEKTKNQIRIQVNKKSFIKTFSK